LIPINLKNRKLWWPPTPSSD